MAQFVVRNLEDDVAEKLRRRARRHARSLEDEVRHILRDVVREVAPIGKLGSRIAKRFATTGLSDEVPEWRGRAATPARFRQ